MTFFNIFSKEKIEEKKKPLIIVDHREKNALVTAELIKRGCAIKFEQLEVADYLVGKTAVERKTISDLKSSIIDKRISNQLAALKQHERYALIIEGIDETMYKGIIHENALRGFVISTVIDRQIPVIYTFNEQDTANYLVLLSKEQKESESSLRAKRPRMSDEEKMQFILEGFPSIGPLTAKKLLLKFKTIRAIINASDEEIERCVGKKASELLRLVKKDYQKVSEFPM